MKIMNEIMQHFLLQKCRNQPEAVRQSAADEETNAPDEPSDESPDEIWYV